MSHEHRRGARTRRCATCGNERDRGAVLAIVAIALVALIGMTAITIDLGRLMIKRRDMQALADVVALDLSRLVDGRTKAVIEADPAWGAALIAAAQRNNELPSKLVATLGTAAKGSPFVATPVGNPTPPNAVQVTATDSISYVFAQVLGSSTGTTNRTAVANLINRNEASFRVGSFLAALDPNTNTIVGQILNSLVPNFSLLSYQGLANANITIDALKASMPLSVGTPDAALNTMVSTYDLMVASATALQAQSGQTSNVTLLNGAASSASMVRNIRLGDVVGAEAGGGTPAGSATVNVLQMLTTTAFIADGDHFISIPNTPLLNIPGIASATVGLKLIEGPVIGGRLEGATASTSQLEVTIQPNINMTTTGNVNACLAPAGLIVGLVGCLLGIVTKVATVTVVASPTISLVAGGATVSQHIDCGNKHLQLSTNPISLSLTAPFSLTASASVFGTPIPSSGPLLRVDVLAQAISAGTVPTTTFTATDAGPHYYVFNPTTQSVGSSPIGLGGLLQTSIGNVTLLGAVNLTNISNAIVGVFQPALNTLMSTLDSALVTPLAKMLGVQLGGAQLTPIDMDCSRNTPQLVG